MQPVRVTDHAPEQVPGQIAFGAEIRTEQVAGKAEASVDVLSEHRVGQQARQVVRADESDESARQATMRSPLFLLPRRIGRRAISDLARGILVDGQRLFRSYRDTIYARPVGERSAEPPGGTTVSDTPRTEANVVRTGVEAALVSPLTVAFAARAEQRLGDKEA